MTGISSNACQPRMGILTLPWGLVQVVPALLLFGACASVPKTAGMSDSVFILTAPHIGEYRIRAQRVEADGAVRIASMPGGLQRTLGWWRGLLMAVTTDYTLRGELLHVVAHPDGEPARDDSWIFPYTQVVATIPAQGGTQNVKLFRHDESVGMLRGPVYGEFRPDYAAVVVEVRRAFERHYLDPGALDAPWFTDYIYRLQAAALRARDDLEFAALAFMAKRSAPVSHIGIERHPECRKPLPDEPGVTAEKLDENVLLLSVRHFFRQEAAIDEIVNQALYDPGLGTLIIDLRNAYGGDVSAMRLAAALIAEPGPGGYFVTGHWWRRHDEHPNRAAVVAASRFRGQSAEELNDQLLIEPLVVLETAALPRTFDGKIYVLVGPDTASAAEAFAAALRYENRATLVGAPTSGKMLSSMWMCVGQDWVLQLPVADYFLPDGVRLEGNPIVPDIDLPAANALSYVREQLTRALHQ